MLGGTHLVRVAAALVVSALAVPAAGDELAVRRGPGADARRSPRPTPSRASALRSISDCGQLRGYVTDVAVETVVQYRYGRAGWMVPWAGPGGGEGDAPSDFTGTNVQEAGVDELDIVKTDGEHLYVVESRSLFVVDSWPPAATALVASVDLDAEPYGLLLLGDLALVASWSWGDAFAPQQPPGTRLDLVDLADRREPRIVRSIQVEGWLVGARMIDGHVYVVVSSPLDLPAEVWDLAWRSDLGLPELDWNATEEEREAAAEAARVILRPLVAAILAETPLDELVPSVTDTSDPVAGAGEARPLLACDELLAPARSAAYSALSVLHLDLGADDPVSAPIDATGILADGFVVYASARSLYVAQASLWWWWGWGGQTTMTSAVHRFSLDPSSGPPVRYAATGEVDGWLLNQFSMDEHDGDLRVATTRFDWWWGTEAGDDEDGSVITVLRDDGRGTLETVGRLGGIAPGEQIHAARFLGDVGYLVTFRQIDPLFTLDLSDPATPRVVGELEVTGYSAYLHPVEGGRLLAVGMEATPEGVLTGLAVSLFDVTDLSGPRLLDRYTLTSSVEQWSWSEALADHHAFTFHRGLLSIPAYVSDSDGGQGFSGLVVLAVDEEAGIRETGRVDHRGLAPETSWIAMRRSVYIEDALYSISSAGLKVNDLEDPSIEWAAVPLSP